MTKQTGKELLSKLSEREIDVLKLYCQHKSQRKIASELYISKNTVKTHIANICEKLEITTSNPGERKLIFFNTFCPLLSTDKTKKPIKEKAPEFKEPEAEYEVEEKTAETQEEKKEKPFTDPEMKDQISNNDGGNEKMAPKKKRGCARFIITMILGALIVIGAWYSWENFFKDMPIVQSIVQLINPDAVIESSPSTPSSSSNSSSSDSESIIEKILPETVENADAYEIGEWHKEDDMWIRLRDYELTSYDYDMIYIYLEIWNKSDNEIHFSWSTESNLVLKDNLGTSYDLTNSYKPGSDNETLLPQERSDLIPGIKKATAQYFASPMFENGVTELFFSVEYLSRFEKVTWRIPVNK